MKAFSYDLCILGECLEKKRQKIGIKNFQTYNKLQTIQRKLKAKGAGLDASVFKFAQDEN